MKEITVYELRRSRGVLCEWCHTREGCQRHHALVGDLKRFHVELTVKENLMLACSYCHTGICVLDTREVKLWFWRRQCERYGVDHMLDWVESLPYKLHISGRLDFVNEFESNHRAGASSKSVTCPMAGELTPSEL